MDNHLVFLTSTSGSIPSGRNARAAARASMVRKGTRPTLTHGTFITFSAKHSDRETNISHSKLLRPLINQHSHGESDRELTSVGDTKHIPRILGPQSIAVDGLLAVATARIQQDLTSVLRKEPSRVRDVLRCRHWAIASFALGELHLTPEVHSAVKYLEHKLLTFEQAGQQRDITWKKYSVALVELQRSLQNPNRRMQSSVLAASHVLAICEMLDDAASSNYLKFVRGIISLSNMQAREGDRSARLHVRSSAGTILVEALLAKRYDAVVDQPWSQTIISAGNEGRLTQTDAICMADSADMIFSRPLTTLTKIPEMAEYNRNELIIRARRLHATLKQSIQNSSFLTARNACPIAMTLGERVAVMLGLDDFVSELTESGRDQAEPIDADSTRFYADVISAL